MSGAGRELRFPLTASALQALVREALHEDHAENDVTTLATVHASRRAGARLVARETGVIAGVPLALAAFRLVDPEVQVRVDAEDGTAVQPGDTVLHVAGHARGILAAERTALNFMQRLSGVASLTHRYVATVQGTHAAILDTRKTTPGLRRLEKWATVCGGATNHRIGLFDAVLIKNNHITAAGGVREALERVRAAGVPHGVAIEIEVRTRGELEEALTFGADHLLLDNLTPDEAADWIAFINGRAKVELSGGMRLEKLREYAATGADYISIGALTHSAPILDLGLDIEIG